MTMAPPPVTALPDVSQEDWNTVILETAKETREQVETLIEALFPDWVIAPGVKRSQREWLVWFVVRINAAYPLWQQDPYHALLRSEEIAWLMEDNYLPMARMGQAPPPQSRPWAALVGNGMVFRGVQKWFQKCYREQARAAGFEV